MTIGTNSTGILALIPARGGSKGVPRKNVLMLAGKPLIAYSIEQALASRHITRTIVSTDDPEIAQVAVDFGAEVPFMRPPEFAEDLSPDIDVFRHALEWLRDTERYTCQLVVHLRPSGPVRRVELIDDAIEKILADPQADSLRSVSLPEQTPYKMWRAVDGHLQPLMKLDEITEPYCLPRQTLPEVYWQNGYVDIVRPNVVLDLGMMCGRRIIPFFINERILEIDYQDSIPIVEAALFELKQGKLPELVQTVKRYPV